MTGEGKQPDMVPMRERADSRPMNATGYPVHDLDPPAPVLVWITKPGRGPLQVQALASGWTARAGRIEYTDEHGRSETTWVWANAIQRRDCQPMLPIQRGEPGPDRP